MAETTAHSKAVLEAVKTLERLELLGKLRPAEKKALEKFRAEQADAQLNVDRTDATYRGFGQGVTLGLKDEVGAALSGGDGSSYGDRLAKERGKNLVAKTRFPKSYGHGEIAGGTATMAAPTMGIMRAGRDLGLLGKTGLGILGGSLAGGAYGFNTGEGGLLPRLKNAAVPAAIGGVTGLVSPGLGAGAGNLVRGMQNLTRNIPGFSARATGAVARPMSKTIQSGTNPQDIMDYLGPEGMLVDMPGNMRKTGQGLAAMPGEGGELLGSKLTERAQGSSGRITRDVDDVMGSADAAFDQRRTLAQERTSKLGPEYDAALLYKEAVPTKDVRAAITSVQRDAASRTSAAADSIKRDLGDTDGVTAAKLHNVRSDLSDEINEAKRAGRDKFVNAMQPILKAIDDELDAIPGYANARTGWANNKAMEEAIDEGRKVFSGSTATAMSPKQLEDKLKGMSEAQKEAYRKGAREWVGALMGTARNDAAAAIREVEKGWTADKIKILFGADEGQRIINRIKAEDTFRGTRSDILLGSQTEMRREASKDLADLRAPDTGQRPGPIKRGVNAVNAAGNAALDSMIYAGRPGVNREVGQILSTQGPQRDALLRQIMTEAAIRGKPTRADTLTRGLLDFAIRSGGTAAAISNN